MTRKPPAMRELSLFSGAGGGLLATKHLLGLETVGYVENNEYCQKVLRARIADGYLDAAPIFGDIRAFIRDGYAEAYSGLVDVVSGGFPCAPFSCAGKRAGEDDARNMWPATIDTIRIIRPRFCFLENVPGLLSSGYFGRILGDLAESGYNARWRVLSAAEVGAPHLRKRLWIVAYSAAIPRLDAGESGEGGPVRDETRGPQPERRSDEIPNPNKQYDDEPGHGASQDGGEQQGPVGILSGRGWRLTEPGVGRVVDGLAKGLVFAWPPEPEGVPRVAQGVPDRVGRLTAIGNGHVPLVAATAWRLLTGG